MDDDEETIKSECRSCGSTDFYESDGFYYCNYCGAKVDGLMVTGIADEDFIDKTGRGGGGLYNAIHTRRSQPTGLSQGTEANPSSQAWYRFTQEEAESNKAITPKKEERGSSYCYSHLDLTGPTEPVDFGPAPTGELGYDDYYNEVRFRYVMGLQWMVQMQCDALIEEFGVSPLICGVVSAVWLRFVAVSGVFKDGWADDAVKESESQTPDGEDDNIKVRSKHRNEPHNSFGQRSVMVWFRSLRKAIPLDYSLALCFLACHVAKEAVLPTDIVKWSIEGKIPYFAAHIEIEKRFNGPSLNCPISSALMFRPLQPVPVQKLEAMAAVIAESVGLHLPPINFHAVASRYLNELSVPSDKILPHACRIYEWSMPPDLWLSANELRLPTRVCVMSILMVAIRILYNLHGFGAWESSLSKSAARQTSELDSEELLHKLETGYSKIGGPCEFTKDLTSYLQYCRDVDNEPVKQLGDKDDTLNQKRLRSEQNDSPTPSGSMQARDPPKEASCEIRRMKTDMEENRFCYIPPRVKVKRPDGYLYYNRKQDEGSYKYVAHADYYILLRSCAKVAQVDIRIMHIAVLGFERRLAWLEKRIQHCLDTNPPSFTCEFCRDDDDTGSELDDLGRTLIPKMKL
ncbi:TATA box-binding protein-associated factor RNA polymerase I subunit B [Linum grandiflorum]